MAQLAAPLRALAVYKIPWRFRRRARIRAVCWDGDNLGHVLALLGGVTELPNGRLEMHNPSQPWNRDTLNVVEVTTNGLGFATVSVSAYGEKFELPRGWWVVRDEASGTSTIMPAPMFKAIARRAER